MRNAIYFASDFHLGVPDYEKSLEREKKVVRWLDEAAKDAEKIYLMGDVFDFWFEHKYTAPKYFTRLLGKLAELSDNGIKIEFFTGNHDMWAFDYLEKEIGLVIRRKPVIHDLQGKKLYLGHGDGLGPGDYGYKFIKKVFANKFCQWVFARLHPNLSMGMANFWSGKSRGKNAKLESFSTLENEWLCKYSKEILEENPAIDYFIFGHRHLPLNLKLGEKSRYLNLGDWFYWCSYVKMVNGEAELLFFEKPETKLPQGNQE